MCSPLRRELRAIVFEVPVGHSERQRQTLDRERSGALLPMCKLLRSDRAIVAVIMGKLVALSGLDNPPSSCLVLASGTIRDPRADFAWRAASILGGHLSQP